MRYPPCEKDMWWCTECPGLWPNTEKNHRCEQWSNMNRIPADVIFEILKKAMVK